MNIRRPGMALAVAVVLTASAGFFVRELVRNWHAFHEGLHLVSSGYFAAAITCMCLGLVSATWQWHFAFNWFSTGKKLRFGESYFFSNAALPGKYLPGRMGYVGVQALLLHAWGIPAPFCVFVNIVVTFFGFIMALATGLVLTGCSPQAHSYRAAIVIALVCLCLGMAFFTRVYPKVFNGMARLVKRFFHKEIAYVPVPSSFIVRYAVVCMGYLAAYLGAMYWACAGAGVALTHQTLLLVLGATLLSEIIGIIVFVVPGGIGIRESALFLMLQTALPASASLAVPLATRFVLLVSDMIIAVSVIPHIRRWRKAIGSAETGKV